jgi:hypothetical protein
MASLAEASFAPPAQLRHSIILISTFGRLTHRMWEMPEMTGCQISGPVQQLRG